MKLLNDSHENGRIWYDADQDISVFEDTQEAAPRCYAWPGTWEDHDDASHRIPAHEFPTPAEARDYVLSLAVGA